MSTKKFKTTLYCGSCIRTIAPMMDGDSKISSWSVDMENESILTVEGEVTTEDVQSTLKSVGYECELISEE